MTDYSCLAQIAEIQKHYASILKYEEDLITLLCKSVTHLIPYLTY